MTRAKVEVVENKYKISGDFHTPEAGTPIWKGEKLCGITNPRNMTYIHTYGGEHVFFHGLSQGKLIASRCDNSDCEAKGTVFMPYRIHCPDCLAKNVDVDITDLAKKTSKVHTFMTTERTGAFNTLKKPIKFINIEFDGVATILMGYLSAGSVEVGSKVLPIFNTKNPTYTILDLSWVVDGTPESDLPEGFTFG